MEHLRSIDRSSDRFTQAIELGSFDEGESFDGLPEPERLRRGGLLAAHWEAIADECEQSRATRLLFSAWTPQQMRDEAAIWREGRDPR